MQHLIAVQSRVCSCSSHLSAIVEEWRSQSWQHTTGRDLRTPVDVPLVNIPKVDHDNLVSHEIPADLPLADPTVAAATYGQRIQYVASTSIEGPVLSPPAYF